MSAPTVETVAMSTLLCDLPAVPAEVRETVAGPLLRALDLVPRTPAENFADSDDSGYVEKDVDAWALRVFGEA